MNRIFQEIAAERVRQDAKWGEQNHPDVDPVLMRRPGGCDARRMAEEYEIPMAHRAKYKCQVADARGVCTWAHILVEEVSEAVEAATVEGEEALRRELIQVAAVATQWLEAIDRRATKRAEAEAHRDAVAEEIEHDLERTR